MSDVIEQVEARKNAHWSDFYANSDVPEKPSTFAQLCAQKFDEFLPSRPGVLLEMGCGNGRDSWFFARSRFNVWGNDICQVSIDKLKSKRVEGIDNQPEFFVADFTDLDKCTHPGISGDSQKPISFVYSRFTLHAVSKAGGTNFLQWTSKNLAQGGVLAIEARSVKDPLYGKGEAVPGQADAFLGETTHAKAHYRRFIRMQELCDELKGLGFEIIETDERSGLSPYKDDDPVLVRVFARKL